MYKYEYAYKYIELKIKDHVKKDWSRFQHILRNKTII